MKTAPVFPPKEIDRAGRVLAQATSGGRPGEEWQRAARLVGRWRAAHGRPLSVFRAGLRTRVSDGGTTAQRLKRLPSIVAKLERLSRIRLSRMQDIGGCRAIVGDADDALRIARELSAGAIRHEPVRHSDYIGRPRPSGYRGLHLVYALSSGPDAGCRDLNIEVQVRSELQHQWATAVETVGTFIGNGLKSGIGDPNWLRFFSLMSTVIARREGKPEVPDTPTNTAELMEEIQEYARTLSVSERLGAFQVLTHRLRAPGAAGGDWFVLQLDPEGRRVTVRAFGEDDLPEATSIYIDSEMEQGWNPRLDVVLVSANSLSDLRSAYPNYFADLTGFRRVFQESVGAR